MLGVCRLGRMGTTLTGESLQRKSSGIAVPHVVIVGGGFGGLSAARALAQSPVRVTLVDKRNYHLFRPLLYQVATGLLSGDQIALPLRSILSGQRNADVLMAEVTEIDTDKGIVRLDNENLRYDFLVLATGISYNYFGHDDWEKFAPGLEALDDADNIRSRILSAFETAERLAALGEGSAETLRQLLTFALVGGGTVGVEMASTMAELVRMSLAKDFRHVDPRLTQILLFEAAPRILPSYPEALSRKAQRHLEGLGVKVYAGTRVEQIDANGVVAGGRRIPSRMVLWSAGVTPSPAARWLGAGADKSGRIKVGQDLSVPGHPNIFAVGDTAEVVAASRNFFGILRPEPKPMHGVAQPAIQEGQYAAEVIHRRVRGQGPPKPFWYWDKGELAIVGRTFAVADLGFARFSGFGAWWMWAVVHIYFLVGFPNRLFVTLQWVISFLTKRRQVRILPDRGGGLNLRD
jgi:NADH dehydrogenase